MSYIPPSPYNPGKYDAAATTNATLIQAGRTLVNFLSMTSNLGSPVWVKLYNKASAPNLASDVPVLKFMIPANMSGAGSNVTVNGLLFTLGLAMAITAGPADTDTTAITLSGPTNPYVGVNWGIQNG